MRIILWACVGLLVSVSLMGAESGVMRGIDANDTLRILKTTADGKLWLYSETDTVALDTLFYRNDTLFLVSNNDVDTMLTVIFDSLYLKYSSSWESEGWITDDTLQVDTTSGGGGGSGDITTVGDGATGAVFTADGAGNSLWFEGSTTDGVETIFTAEDPTTADKTITLPNATGYAVVDVTKCTDIEGTGLSITSSTLNWDCPNDDILEAHLKCVNAATDEDIFTYEATTGDFEWHTLAEMNPDYTDSSDVNGWNYFNTEAELTGLLDDNYEGELNNEAGLYAALSDISDFAQPTEVPGMTATKVKIIFAFCLYTVADGMDGVAIQFPRAMTITKVTMKCKDGTNVVGRLYEVDGDGDPADKVGIESADWTVTTTETEDASFNNATLDAGDYLWWETTSVSGIVTMFTCTVEGYET